MIATFSKSAQQAQLTSFFVNPLLTTLRAHFTGAGDSRLAAAVGGINPIHHFSVIARSHDQGHGLRGLWDDFLVLGIFTLMLVVVSVWRFRKMLS